MMTLMMKIIGEMIIQMKKKQIGKAYFILSFAIVFAVDKYIHTPKLLCFIVHNSSNFCSDGDGGLASRFGKVTFGK